MGDVVLGLLSLSKRRAVGVQVRLEDGAMTRQA